MTRALATTRAVTHHTAEAPPSARDDAVAVEEPLEIRVEGRSIAITMRTPGHDEELAAGFLLTEGVVERAADIFEINQCPTTAEQTGNIIDVLLRHPEKLDYAALTRHVFSSSSCGLCGKATLEAVGRRFPPLPPGPTLRLDQLHAVAAQLFSAQSTFHATGGLHAAALFDAAGRVLVVREDVGRHNAVDKVVGHALLHAQPDSRPHDTPPSELQTQISHLPSPVGLFVSGRVSFEIMQKALAARLSIVAAVSAPTSLAVDFARTHGQTLVGFLRPGRANHYAGHLAP
jgi:FdhD protein